MANNDIEALKREKRVLQETNRTLTEQNLSLQSEIKVSTANLDSLLADEEAKTTRLQELDAQDTTLRAGIIELEQQLHVKQKALDSLEREYIARKTQYDKDLQDLDKKQRNLSDTVLLGRQEIENMRQELATRLTMLDERDKNLRIREAKAEEQEKSIIRNYNLLQL